MSRYSKMIVAAVGAVCTWATTYFPDNHNVQIIVGLAVALATVASVYLVPNTPPAGQAADPAVSEQGQKGYAAIELLVMVLVIVIILVVLLRIL